VERIGYANNILSREYGKFQNLGGAEMVDSRHLYIVLDTLFRPESEGTPNKADSFSLMNAIPTTTQHVLAYLDKIETTM
jgi:hypothetical protein